LNSVSKTLLELMKVIAQNQIKLSKKVDLMNKRLKNFLNEAVNTAPIDLNSLSVKEEPVEDFSEFAIDDTPKKVTSSSGGVGVRTITSKNNNPFDPTWSSQKETVKKEEEKLPKGISRSKSIEELFPEVVGVDEQVKQLEEEIKRMTPDPRTTPPPPPRPKQPTMEDFIQKNMAIQKNLSIPETPVIPEVKPKKRKTTKTKTDDTSKKES